MNKITELLTASILLALYYKIFLSNNIISLFINIRSNQRKCKNSFDLKNNKISRSIHFLLKNKIRDRDRSKRVMGECN